jgi:hypothetical protein
MAAPTLSICIATLNRASFLADTLACLVAQCGPDVEFVIVDGASTDDTPAVVEAARRAHPRLKYERLAQKGGVDQDYCRAIELAEGDYVWLFTDDDLVRPGAVDAVRRAIASDYDLVVVNAEVRDVSLERVLQPRVMPIDVDQVMAPGDIDTLFRTTVNHLSFIGAVVIRRSLWLARDARSYFGTVFVHVGVIFQAPLPGRALALAEPLIVIRYGNALWTAKSFEISLFKWPGLLWSFSAVSETAKAAVTPAEPWRRPTALAVFRARGAYSRDHYRRLVRPRLRPGLTRAWAAVIASFPAVVLNALLIAYLTIAKWRHDTPDIRLDDLRGAPTYYRRRLAAWFAGGRA